jgi:bifunctional DNA-binding transcriptional regulator/antitoxin component of YhaV-PrlF toxin-antitoxin module
MRVILPKSSAAVPGRETEFVSIRPEPSHKRHRQVSFSTSLSRKLQLNIGDAVVIYADGRKLRFKLRPAKKEELVVAHRLKADNSMVCVVTSNLPEPEFRTNRYTANTSEAGWITIDLNEHDEAVAAPAASKIRGIK